MRPAHPLLPLLLVFTLLFAQHGAARHAFVHALAEQTQQDQQAPHSPVCEQCTAYAHLSGALGSSTHSFILVAVSGQTAQHDDTAFRSIHTLAAVARGPPTLLQKSA